MENRFPPISAAVAKPPPNFPGDLEPERKSRKELQHLARYDGSHDYPYCWGYTVFRTVYTPGSDKAVTTALERLASYACYYACSEDFITRKPQAIIDGLDKRPVEELWSRYHTEVVEDAQALSNASESQVGDFFNTWIGQHRRPVGRVNDQNARFVFCLILDEDSLENILALPAEPTGPFIHPAPQDSKGGGWVKIISNRTRSEEEEECGSRYWLRVGIADYLWNLWFMQSDPDVLIEEWGFPDPEDEVQNLWGTPDDWFRHIMARKDG